MKFEELAMRLREVFNNVIRGQKIAILLTVR